MNKFHKSLGVENIGTHLLTHAEWNGMPEFFSTGSNETGIRKLRDGKVIDGSFEVIQHGWRDIEKASNVIKKCLRKGYAANRICKIMDRIVK